MEDNKLETISKKGRPKTIKTETTTEKTDEVKIVKEKKVEKINIRTLPLHTVINVRSNVFGELIYKSIKNGFKVSWNDNITPLGFTLDELLIMRNTQPKFFERTWIVIDGFIDTEISETLSAEDIYEYLQATKFYKSFLCPENIDELFTMKPDDIVKRLRGTSTINKDAVIIRANEMIESGELDSIRVITTLEKELGCELYKCD